MSWKRRETQLGLNLGTAANRLRKMVMFQLAQETNRDTCYRCQTKILTCDDISIEHKIPWLDSENPAAMFFDLKNIAFSHLHCNVSARRIHRKYEGNERERHCARQSVWAQQHYTTEMRRKKRQRRRERGHPKP